MEIWMFLLLKKNLSNRKEVKTYSKLESKIDDVIKFVKKEIKEGNQIFWVCPLIEESKKLDHQSSVKNMNFLIKFFQIMLLYFMEKLIMKKKKKY